MVESHDKLIMEMAKDYGLNHMGENDDDEDDDDYDGGDATATLGLGATILSLWCSDTRATVAPAHR
jgi:hypothetical protein